VDRFARAGLLLACLLDAGCGAAGPVVTLHEGRQGSVALERVAHPAFQAAHPLVLGPDLLARVLRGVRLPPEAAGSSTTGGQATRLFSEGQVLFLAPLLAEALSKAAPDQRVRFTAGETGRAGVAPTTGLLFAHGRSLHLILVPPSGQASGPSGLRFVPDVARRPESFQQVPGSSAPGGQAFAIDYQLLARLPAAIEEVGPPPDLAAPTARPPGDGRADEVRAMKDLIVEKDLEIQALKSDLERLKKQVADQAEQLRKLQGGKRPAAPGKDGAR
jgi:hypothetical protein